MKMPGSISWLALAAPLLVVSPIVGHASPSRTQSDSPDHPICRSRAKLGSRIARERICRTAEEWRLYEKDLEQSRRDFANGGLPEPERNKGIFPCSPSQPC